jgi:hypothetical protein
MLAQLASLHETTPQAAHPHSALSLISKPIRLLSYSIALQHTNSIYNSQIIQRKDMACEKILPINNEKTGQKKPWTLVSSMTQKPWTLVSSIRIVDMYEHLDATFIKHINDTKTLVTGYRGWSPWVEYMGGLKQGIHVALVFSIKLMKTATHSIKLMKTATQTMQRTHINKQLAPQLTYLWS